MMMSDLHTPALEVRDLAKHYPFRRGWFGRGGQGAVHAVDGVSFTLPRGETLALVGESGCGKSTIAKLILRLIEPTAGSVLLEGTDLAGLDDTALRQARQRIQMVFQDPFASLNPRLNAAAIVGEPLVNYGIGDTAARAAQVDALFDRVGLARYQRDRYPHQFSGGQRQRLGIARALALNPAVVVADEPVSALDVSVQAQILNLMADLQRELGLSYLFISHDLGVVEYISTTVAVMYLGAIVEVAPRQRFFSAAAHPYARALLDAVPSPDPARRRRRILLQGEVPSASALPSGCRFRTRCPQATKLCADVVPGLREIAPQHHVACHHVEIA
ncbi:oligopeptide/dipeptide ABC transporter ATP-binding protein [Ferrovibrio terrae]|uniref:ABC transporter ATP-binding protein n=1 Tax=Ferrovibrio terrae TaxID=2594003 RepID=UPI003137E7FD